MQRATKYAWLMVAALCLIGTQTTSAQAPELGDDFIFFVNGSNVLLTGFAGEVVNDPLNPTSGNKVSKFGYGNWNAVGWNWDRKVGVDMTKNVSTNPAETDSLYFKLLSDPANANQPSVWLSFFDKTDDSGANDGSADLLFRLNWTIPNEFHDGTWRDIAIALPPSTFAALDSAKAGVDLMGNPLTVPMDSLTKQWSYGGSWSNGGFGVWVPSEPLWQEFEWNGVMQFGAFWDNNTSGGPIYLDDVYVGPSRLDLSSASDPGEALAGVTVAEGIRGNKVTWSHSPGLGGYKVYFALNEISDVTAAGVSSLGTVNFNGPFEVNHSVEVPHSSFSPLTVHYAVTTLSQFGVENTDISNSKGSIANPNLPSKPIIPQLTDAQATTIFNNLVAGNFVNEGFPPEVGPFVVDSLHSQLSESLVLPSNNADNSAKIWLGYTSQNELFVYAEVLDDDLNFGPSTTPGSEMWQFDSVEMGWGAYDVRSVNGGNILGSSTHTDPGDDRANAPDYQFRFGLYGTPDAIEADGVKHVGFGINGPNEGGAMRGDLLKDASDNVIGYKVLGFYDLNGLGPSDNSDGILTPPGADELVLIPFTIALNDNDKVNNEAARRHQINWSLNPTLTNQWWNTPSQWTPVAMVGGNLITGIETDDNGIPQTFVLEQNYPNPFNPNTTITFSVPSPERITLSVFNVLGQKMATLIDGQMTSAGVHKLDFDASRLGSGMYLYRLEAGSKFVQTRVMSLVK